MHLWLINSFSWCWLPSLTVKYFHVINSRISSVGRSPDPFKLQLRMERVETIISNQHLFAVGVLLVNRQSYVLRPVNHNYPPVCCLFLRERFPLNGSTGFPDFHSCWTLSGLQPWPWATPCSIRTCDSRTTGRSCHSVTLFWTVWRCRLAFVGGRFRWRRTNLGRKKRTHSL